MQTHPRFRPDLLGLTKWLETQDRGTEYDYSDPEDCLLCRFANAITGKRLLWSEVLSLIYGETFERNDDRIRAAVYSECTYGAALDRCRREIAKSMHERF